MRWAGDLDRAIARALGAAYGPWLALVTLPPGCGVLWVVLEWQHRPAANDDRH